MTYGQPACGHPQAVFVDNDLGGSWVCNRCDAPDPVAVLRTVLADVPAPPLSYSEAEIRAAAMHDSAGNPLPAYAEHFAGHESPTTTIARIRLALLKIVAADTYARHGAAHAQIARCVRIATAALNGEDPEA